MADAEAARFLLRATFSASSGAIAAVRQEGREAWLDRHLNQSNDQSAKKFFADHGLDAINSEREFARDRLTDRVIWSQLMAGGNAVRKRVALALSEFFVVSANHLNIVWPAHAVAAFWDILNDNAFGNFRDLLKDVSLSPAMGAFLDTIGSRKDDPRTGRVPDENFARELMQLFSIGLHELNIDGSLKTSNGEPIETYTNEDVVGLARVFTGYDVDVSGLNIVEDPRLPRVWIPEVEAVRRPLTADPAKWLRPEAASQHSLDEKRFLGASIPPGIGPEASLTTALDVLFLHPNVGPFFCKQMIKRLVTSNPSGDYVARVASVFNNNGSGVRGDLAAVFRAIFLDADTHTELSLNDMRFGKLREPIVRFAQFARSFNLHSPGREGVTRDLSDESTLLGQAPLRSPSVFNFFRPGFVPSRSVTMANDMVGPEFQIVNETSVAGYVNFLELTVKGRGFWLNDLEPDYSREIELAPDVGRLVDHLDLTLTAGQLRMATRSAITSALESIAVLDTDSDDRKLIRVHAAVMLIFASNDYLIQK